MKVRNHDRSDVPDKKERMHVNANITDMWMCILLVRISSVNDIYRGYSMVLYLYNSFDEYTDISADSRIAKKEESYFLANNYGFLPRCDNYSRRIMNAN